MINMLCMRSDGLRVEEGEGAGRRQVGVGFSTSRRELKSEWRAWEDWVGWGNVPLEETNLLGEFPDVFPELLE